MSTAQQVSSEATYCTFVLKIFTTYVYINDAQKLSQWIVWYLSNEVCADEALIIVICIHRNLCRHSELGMLLYQCMETAQKSVPE